MSVHNHPPYRPICNERMVGDQLRGACLNDDGTERDESGGGLCEGLAPFCCNNPDCPVHGDRIDAAELDAARLVGDMAEAEVVTLRARAESAEAALAGLREGIEALRAQSNDEALTHWSRHQEASDDGNLDRANHEGSMAEVFEQTSAALRALLALTPDAPARTIPTTASVRANLAADTAADNKARWNRALKGGA